MREWEEWEGTGEGMQEDDTEITIMPCLSWLKIRKSGSLQALPDFLWKISTLHRLTIKRCTILERRFGKGGSEFPKISHIPNMKIGYETIREDGVWKPPLSTESDIVALTNFFNQILSS